MSRITPFAAPSGVYARWLDRLEEAGGATVPFPEVAGKSFARAVIAGGLTLSVPVAGGASVFKRREHPAGLILSQHGRWQEIHLGAWRSAYGRAPFFPHLFPEIEEIYRNHSTGSFGEFTLRLHHLALRWLDLPDSAKMIADWHLRNPVQADAIEREYVGKFNTEISIFDPLFRFGKETLLILAGATNVEVVLSS